VAALTPSYAAALTMVMATGVESGLKTHQPNEIFEAAEIKLSAEEVSAIEKPCLPHPILGHEQRNRREW
jgi:hypothetical protein